MKYFLINLIKHFLMNIFFFCYKVPLPLIDFFFSFSCLVEEAGLLSLSLQLLLFRSKTSKGKFQFQWPPSGSSRNSRTFRKILQPLAALVIFSLSQTPFSALNTPHAWIYEFCTFIYTGLYRFSICFMGLLCFSRFRFLLLVCLGSVMLYE